MRFGAEGLLGEEKRTTEFSAAINYLGEICYARRIYIPGIKELKTEVWQMKTILTLSQMLNCPLDCLMPTTDSGETLLTHTYGIPIRFGKESADTAATNSGGGKSREKPMQRIL